MGGEIRHVPRGLFKGDDTVVTMPNLNEGGRFRTDAEMAQWVGKTVIPRILSSASINTAKVRQKQRERHERHRQHDGATGKMRVAQALDILGLAEGASEKEIRAAYTRLMKRVHPDVGGSNVFAEQLNAARDVLLGQPPQ